MYGNDGIAAQHERSRGAADDCLRAAASETVSEAGCDELKKTPRLDSRGVLENQMVSVVSAFSALRIFRSMERIIGIASTSVIV